MEDAVAMVLQHLRMDVEARIAKLCYFLGQELDAIHRVAEDDGLVYLELHHTYKLGSMANHRLLG